MYFNRFKSMMFITGSFRQSQMYSFSTSSHKWQHFKPSKNIMLPPNAFKDKIAFITGGGTGLGKAITFMLSSLGAQTVIVSRKLDVLQKTSEEISNLTKQQVLPLSVDVRDPEAIKQAVDECETKLGLPDIIINNAAGNFICPTERLSSNAWKTIIDIVLNGTAFVTLDIGKRLIKAQKGGVFLSISATYTASGSGFVVPSCAAKSGVEAITKSLAVEWGKYGMRFNCIMPGALETKGASSRLDPDGTFWQKILAKIPTKRIGELEEIANLATYLVSDYSNWLTGEIIKIDGGEYNNSAGSFNELVNLPNDEWDRLEKKIRNVKGS